MVVLNYNVRYFLELCVLSVQAALKNLDAEIIVVDNDSTDHSCEMMRSRFPEVKLIENRQNVGFPKGNNLGVAAANGKYICILNPDTVVAEDTFEKVIARYEASAIKTGIVGCKLVDGTGNFLPESKRGTPTPWVAFTKIFGLYRVSNFFGRYYAQHLSENQSGQVDILVGAFMVMKRGLYIDIGGFDENCFMYSDDIDLSYTVLQNGYQNQYFAETAIVHFKGESTVKDGLYMRRFQEAMNFFYRKHFRVSLFFSAFMRVGIVLFSVIKMFQGKPKSFAKPNQYIVVSDDALLKQKIATQFQKRVEMVAHTKSFAQKPHTEIIFDNNFVSFADIISSMQTHRNCGFTFKILPKNSNFIIGSNSSNDRGEVIILTSHDV